MKSEDEFSVWYNDIIEKAELSDKRYPIKGMNVWLPYGWKLMLNIDNIIREEMNRMNFNEVMFPLLITQTEFGKEKKHIKGFDSQVYWVTSAGESKLDIPLLLRPTSETAMYPMFALWVRSHADLPLRIYQIISTYRYETKQTRSFIRVREIHFFEAHTCHESFEDAEKQIEEYFRVIEKLAKKLCLPYIVAKRPDWDKFPGAFYSTGIDVFMPTGKTLQVASVHQYKDNFSNVYNIVFETPTGEHKYVHQTTFGMSERLLGATISAHNDSRGLILPPEIAPIQIVIIPIFAKESQKEAVMKEALSVKKKLVRKFRVHLDDRAEKTPGSKFYDWELKGVPLRIEIGPKECENKTLTLVRRDDCKKTEIKKEFLLKKAGEKLNEIAKELLRRAEKALNENTRTVESLQEIKTLGIYRMGWCGKEECALSIEKATDMKVLGPGLEKDSLKEKKCINCAGKASSVIYLAKSY